MTVVIGFIIVIICVFGGFMMSGGILMTLWHPPELVIIAGAAIGAFIATNPAKVSIAVVKAIPALLKGGGYKKDIYMDLLGLLFELFTKARKEGLMSLEEHVEEPEQSPIFANYPKILADHHVVEFLTDYLRLMVSGSASAMEMENLMDVELETHHEEAGRVAAAVAGMGDGLPGFGIVAAVMGVVITMGSIDQGAAVIGAKVGAALVGTFVGILLSYGFAAPLAGALGFKASDEANFILVIKVALLASLNGYSPQVAVEFGRKAIYPSERPGFSELEEFVKQKK